MALMPGQELPAGGIVAAFGQLRERLPVPGAVFPPVLVLPADAPAQLYAVVVVEGDAALVEQDVHIGGEEEPVAGEVGGAQ